MCQRAAFKLSPSENAIRLFVFSLIIWNICNDAQGRPSCSFPSVLWSRDQSATTTVAGPMSSQRSWIAEEKHKSNEPAYESRKYIAARETELEMTFQIATLCNGQACVRKEANHTMYCMSAEGNDKYRVRRLANGYEEILCLKFVIRSRNIVQVWASRPSDTNMENLCSDTELRRNEWPWIAQNDVEWSPCPFSGGFDFHEYPNDKKKVCERIPRPSHLDVDCVTGDGLHFSFPDSFCTVFHITDTAHSLQCFGSWNEDSYTFIVAASAGRSPQYVLRMPRLSGPSRLVRQQSQQLDVILYYSPVCPLADNGLPSTTGQVMSMTLKLRRAEVSPIEDRGCEFPVNFQGNWLLMENRRPESVTISDGVIQSHAIFGDVICKARNRKTSMYKVVSAFNNGCRARFTCVDFNFDDKLQLLRFRLSRSLRADHPFDSMCKFETDPLPLGPRFRSEDYKVLYPVSRTRQHSCGLDGLVRVTVTSQSMVSSSMTSVRSPLDLSDAGRSRDCDGSLSDWNPFTCILTSSMVLTYRNCTTDNALVHREFICEAYIDLQPGYRMLFVKNNDNNDFVYSCWVIRMTANSSSDREPGHHHYHHQQQQQQRPPWLTVSTLPRSMCNEHRNPADLLQRSSVAFYVLPDPRDTHCIVMTKDVRHQGIGGIRYYYKDKNNTRIVKTQRPPAAMHSSAAMSSGAMLITSRMTSRTVLSLAVVFYFIICMAHIGSS